MNHNELTLEVLKAQDLQDWQEHIAWQEVVGPELKKVKDLLTQQLVALSLGQKIDGITVEQVAGKIFGLDWIQKEISRIIEKGSYSSKVLSSTDL